MPDAALHLLAFVAATAGMAGFALAKDIHWRQLFATTLQTGAVRTTCNALGMVLLATSFLLCALADPVSMAVLVWPMLIGLAAATIATLLTVQARN